MVCLDVPWPADYGGAIDMMNRIKAFYETGINIHLHYFSYNNRGTPKELENYCKTVQTYERKSFKESYNLKIPYIVASRINARLIENLNKDNHPVLLEGLHTTGIIPYISKTNRKICVRQHNDEAVYYKELAKSTFNFVKKAYYTRESTLIKKYQKTLPHNVSYACITHDDCKRMLKLGYTNVVHVPAFANWQKVDAQEGIGNLCLFHGNLSVSENEKAALWLLCNVFNKVRVPFVIAGKNPSKRLVKAAQLCQHTCIISNPTNEELNDLIQKAHINILPLLNKHVTGIRLKLLHALYKGRHCVVNQAMVSGTNLEAACHIGNNADALASIISQLYYMPFNDEEILLRKNLLEAQFNNQQNIPLFTNLLW
ncbi:MAG: glycosyltransferase family 4 protein [Niabella sp.]